MRADESLNTGQWLRLGTLFDAALDLPPEQRERYIVENCANDAEFADRLRRMLAADAGANESAFLATPLIGPRADTWRDVVPIDYVSGSRRFGAYRLLKLIGRGGMGEVHLAERGDGEFEQRVALKLLPQPTPGLIQRFRQERQILARLQHPNIARLLDGGVGEADVPYFAMEYVEGVPITRYAVEQHLDVVKTLQLFLGVCEAVQYAHRNLVVHRDIKPSNILVTADGTPKLLDFGIAKVIQTSATDTAPTQTRIFTPDYAAPEQIRGEAITTATDVYTLGVLLFELLCGVKPYTLSRDITLEQAILSTDPPSPSDAVPKWTDDGALRRRKLRGDLDRIVLMALAKEPERRYSSVEAFATDIRRHLGGRPIAALGANATYRLRKFIRRNRKGFAASAVVVIALIAATGFSLWQAKLASQQARRAEAEAATANAVQDFMIKAFTQAEPWRSSGHPPNALELAESAMAHVDSDLAGQPMAKVKMYNALGRLFRVAGDVRLSSVAGAKAVATLEAMPAVDALSVHDARMGLFFSLIYTGDFAGAEKVFSVVSATPIKDEARRIIVGDARALLARDRGRLQEYYALERVIEPRTRAFYGNQSNKTAQATWHLYEAALMIGRYGEAQDALEQTYRINSALNAVEAPVRVEGLMNLLALAAERGSAAVAVDPATRIAERTRTLFGRSGYLSDSLVRLGRIQRLAGKTSAAIVSLVEAGRILDDPAQGNELHGAVGDKELGLAYLESNQPQAAEPLLQQAQAVYAGIGGKADPRALAVAAALARCAWLQRQPQALQQLRTLTKQARAEQLAELPEILDWLAEALRDAGQPDEAANTWRNSLSQLELQGRALSATALRVHRSLALVLAAGARTDEAVHEAQASLDQAMAMQGAPGLIAETAVRRIAQPRAGDADLMAAEQARAFALPHPGAPLVELTLRDLAAMAPVAAHATDAAAK